MDDNPLLESLELGNYCFSKGTTLTITSNNKESINSKELPKLKKIVMGDYCFNIAATSFSLTSVISKVVIIYRPSSTGINYHGLKYIQGSNRV